MSRNIFGSPFRFPTTNGVFRVKKAETKDCVGTVFFLVFLASKSAMPDHPHPQEFYA
jgi:hypothetical protein